MLFTSLSYGEQRGLLTLVDILDLVAEFGKNGFHDVFKVDGSADERCVMCDGVPKSWPEKPSTQRCLPYIVSLDQRFNGRFGQWRRRVAKRCSPSSRHRGLKDNIATIFVSDLIGKCCVGKFTSSFSSVPHTFTVSGKQSPGKVTLGRKSIPRSRPSKTFDAPIYVASHGRLPASRNFTSMGAIPCLRLYRLSNC